MNCSNCGAENTPGAKFCNNCGAGLSARCATCGAEQPAGAKFCNNCGARLPAAEPAPAAQAPTNLDRFIPRELLRKLDAARADGQMVGERRVVTMLFCDVTGSTAAAARFDPEEWAEIINGAFARMIEPVYRYEGTIARLMGDGLLAFFGAPIAHEDDPQRAVLAALEIADGVREYGAEIRRQWGIDLAVRVGVNTGLVVVGAVGSDLRMEYSALGDAINLAARMEQTAPPGRVQIAEATYRLVAPLFDVEKVESLELKGVAEPVSAWRVVGRRALPGSLRGIAGLSSPLVGRDAELAGLSDVLRDLTKGRGGIVSVIGEAGLGKSRLIAEALASAGSVFRRLEGRSQSYQTTSPYAPFIDALAQSAGLSPEMSGPERYARLRERIDDRQPGAGEELAPFIAQPLGLPVDAADEDRYRFLEPPILRGRIFQAVAVWIEMLAAERPTVLYLDDIHWIDPTSLELLGQLMPLVQRAPLAVVLAFRPRPDDASWLFHESLRAGYPDRYRAIQLAPLDETQGRELVGNLLAIEDLPESVRRLIMETAEGNPFFLEEIIRSLLDAGLVERQGDHWRATADIVKLRIPDTLIGVITARLDRLSDADKQVIQAAAVLGREFDHDTLADLSPDAAHLEAALATLRRRELIYPTSAGRYAFKHGLTQEAAYESLLLSRRRQLHHLAADAIREREPERAGEIARHYLAARQPGQAVPWLVQAGHQAAQGFAAAEAVGYYEQALEYEDLGDTSTIRAAYEGMGGIFSMGDPEQALAAFERMLAAAEARADTAMIVSALNKAGSILALMMGRFDDAGLYLDRAERLVGETADPDGYAEMSIVRCQMCTAQADFDSIIRYMDGVIDSSLETGNDRNLVLGLGHTAWSMVSLNRFDDAWIKAQETVALARRIGDRLHEADMKAAVLPLVYVRNGEQDAALISAREGVSLARRIGSVTVVADGEWITADILRSRGRYEEALAAGQRSIEAAMPLESFMPFYLVHPLGVVGTTYLEISDRFTDKIAEFHRHAMRLLETPVGQIGGGVAWADLGWCALTLNDTEIAGEMFGKGLNTPTMMMNTQRPRHLAGSALVHLSRGEQAEALRLAEEALAYAANYGMKNLYPLMQLTHGKVLAAMGRDEEALDAYHTAEEEARAMGLLPLLLQTHVVAARSLSALGRRDEAARAEGEARGTMGAIADLFVDDALRAAYVESATRRINRGIAAN